MKTISHWAEIYIGIPYSIYPQDTNGYNCFSLIKDIQYDQYGIEIDVGFDFKYITNLMAIAKEFKSTSEYRNWIEVSHAQEGDLVLMSTNNTPIHIGVWIDINDTKGIIHSIEQYGVVFSKYENLNQTGYKILGFYRHRSHYE